MYPKDDDEDDDDDGSGAVRLELTVIGLPQRSRSCSEGE